MMFRLGYLDKVPQSNNGFADYGTLCHSVLENYATGKTPIFAMAEEYKRRFDNEVLSPFPPFPRGMAQKYYEAGLTYFENFAGFGNYEIISAEERFELDIGGHLFVGVADLVLRNKDTG